MSLYRRGSVWWVEFTVHGRRIRESAETSDRKQAQEFQEKRKSELWRQLKLGEPEAVTWGQAVKKWLSLKDRGLADRYRIRDMGITLSSSMPLSRSEAETALSGWSGSTFNRALAVLLSVHSASQVTPPSVKKQPTATARTRWLSSQEWRRLLTSLESESPLLAQAARFAVATGLRENNVLNLTWGQIDLRRAVARFDAAEMKGRVAHGIPLSDAAMKVLSERRGKHKTYVFAHPDSGKPFYKASNRAWYKAVKKAKLKGFRWHDLRHTFAAWAVQSGVTLQELMELGGWKTYSMVLRYAHLSPDHLRVAVARIRPVEGSKGTKRPTAGG